MEFPAVLGGISEEYDPLRVQPTQQFPEPLSVGKLDVGNFAFSNTANTLQARNYLNYFQGGQSR